MTAVDRSLAADNVRRAVETTGKHQQQTRVNQQVRHSPATGEGIYHDHIQPAYGKEHQDGERYAAVYRYRESAFDKQREGKQSHQDTGNYPRLTAQEQVPDRLAEIQDNRKGE